MGGVGVLFSVMVLVIWISNNSVLTREKTLRNELLPELDAAHQLTAAVAGLQSQGFLLRASTTDDELHDRRERLDLIIAEILQILDSMDTTDSGVLFSLRHSVENLTGVASGLTQIREQQIALQSQIKDEMPYRLEVLKDLDKAVQSQVVSLTDKLLEISVSMEEMDAAFQAGAVAEDVFSARILEYEDISLSIQDHLLFSRDIVSLIAVVEKVPLLIDKKSVVAALQQRDLIVSAMASRSIYMSKNRHGEALLGQLRNLRVKMEGKESLFTLHDTMLTQGSVQDTMQTLLREHTAAILQQTGKLRNETRSTANQLARETVTGLDQSRTLPVLLSLFAMLLLGVVSYWLLYRRTVLPLVAITQQLDDVGSVQFPTTMPEYYFKELDALSSATRQLDTAQKDMYLQDSQMQKINRDLLRANEELQQFAHIASHDLQEPLRKLQQFSEILKEDYGSSLDDDATFFIDTIHDSARRMSLLIKETLAYSRTGSSNQKFASVDLTKLLHQLCDEMDVATREARGEFFIEPLPVVMANELGMGQLFRNLMINGLKYRKPDTPAQIRICVDKSTGAEDGLLHIQVQDDGIGIPAKYLQRIFIPFERLHGNNLPGTGLGLAICKKVCESHGWNLSVTSEVDVGTQFLISIPLSSVQSV